MSDPPASGAGETPPSGGQTPAAAAPSPSSPPPTAQPTPAVPAAAPTAPASSPPAPELPPLEPETPISWTGTDGQEQVATLQELTTRYATAPDLSAGEIEQFKLIQKASEGDVEAGKKLLELSAAKTAPAAAPPQPGSPEEKIAALEGQLNELHRQVAGAQPIVGQLQQAQEMGLFKRVIEQHKDKLPHLAHHPEGAVRAQAQWTEFRKMAAANNIDLDKHPRAGDALAMALQRTEARFAQDAQVFKNFDGSPAAPPPGVQAVMPAGAPGAGPAGEPPPGAATFLNGQWVDRYGRPVSGVTPTGQEMPIPGGVPTPNQAAGAPGPGAGVQPQGPMDEDAFRQHIRQRAAAIGAGG